MYTKHILSDAKISELSAEEIDDLTYRLGRARSGQRSGAIAELLSAALAKAGIVGAYRLDLNTWDWEDGYAPYFGDIVVRRDGGNQTFELDSAADGPLMDLITAEARAIGLGEYSRVKVDVASGAVDVD